VNPTLLGLILAAYVIGLILFRRLNYGLLTYVWGAFGLTLNGALLGQFAGWNVALGHLEAVNVIAIADLFGFQLELFGQAGLLVPDPSGWSALTVGIECSTLIEAFTFLGLIGFYPRLSPAGRLKRLAAGLAATYLLNLGRIAIIIFMIYFFGKPFLPLAHVVLARLFFFVGIVWVYWRLLTLPTLHIIRRDLEVSGRAVT